MLKLEVLSSIERKLWLLIVLRWEGGTCQGLWLLTALHQLAPALSHPPCPPSPKRETSALVFLSVEKSCFSDYLSIKAQLIIKLNEEDRLPKVMATVITSDALCWVQEQPAQPGPDLRAPPPPHTLAVHLAPVLRP